MRLFGALLTAILLFSLGTGAEAGTGTKTVSALQKKYEDIETVSARFTQEAFSKAMNATEKSAGRVFFKKPGRMRWDYEGANADRIISDGKRIWFVQGDLRQIVETGADGAPAIGRDFLSGLGSIERDFAIEEIKPGAAEAKAGATFKLALTPKTKDASIRRLLLLLDRDYLVRQTIVEDNFGNETRVTFEDTKLNEDLSEALFKLVTPKGFRVVKP
jgi:outer membrane lipoprotein carrier protein